MVVEISASATGVFIPEFNENKELPVAEQIKVTYKRPTIATKEKLFPRQFQFDQSGQAQMAITIDREKIIKELVTKIENLSYMDAGTEIGIKTATQLFVAPVEFDAFIEELYTFLNEVVNAKVDEKN